MGADRPSWFDDIDEGIVLLDGARVVRLNRRAAELLGVAQEPATGAPLMTVLRDHRLERVALGGEPEELSLNGRVLRARPIAGGLAISDLTELRAAGEDARSLLAVLSHELRTPATTISAALEALRHDLPRAQRERFLAHAQAETARLVRLIEDLTVGTRPPRERTLELRSVIDRALTILAPVLEERAIEPRRDVDDLLVRADGDKLLQVVLNLVENAAVHGPASSVVTVIAGATDSVASVLVRDRGVPLPAEASDRLFHANVRGGSGKGSGLGLYIVRTLVERWGGRAWWKPLDTGNEFGFSVPLARDSTYSLPERKRRR